MYYFSAMVCIILVQGEPNGVAFVMTTKPEIAPGWHRFGLEASPLLPRSTITTSLMSPIAPAVCPLADTQSLRLNNEKRLSGGASCTIQKMPGSQETRTPQMGLPPNGSSRR